MSTQTSSTLLPPQILVQKAGSGDEVECSVHTLPKPLLREFRHVFHDTYLKRPESASGSSMVHTMASDEDVNMDGHMDTDPNMVQQQQLELLAIPTNQHAREDLVAIGDHIEKEKDRLLNVVCTNNSCRLSSGIVIL